MLWRQSSEYSRSIFFTRISVDNNDTAASFWNVDLYKCYYNCVTSLVGKRVSVGFPRVMFGLHYVTLDNYTVDLGE